MTDKTHYAVIAGELAPGARVSDEQFSKIPDLIRALAMVKKAASIAIEQGLTLVDLIMTMTLHLTK